MEADLDDIASGSKNYEEVLDDILEGTTELS
jgi:DNA topoisomerase IA